MANLNRRDFLRNAGLAGAATAAACTYPEYDPKTPKENALPYVVQPEDVLPGTASYFSTLCVGCANACGLVARNREGRVVMVEGNPDHPDGSGLCTRGHMDLLATYSPDRPDAPMDAGKATTWDEAVAKIVAAAQAARAAGKGVAWLGQYRTGSLARALDELAGGGDLRRVHWEPLGVETLLAASRAVFGKDALPSYELADAHVVVSFGMDFLGSAFDAMHLAKGWAAAKDPAHGGFVARFVAIEPRVGTTSSQADNFLAPNPGTEAQVALALAKLVAEKTGYAGPAAGLLAGIDVAAAASASGLSDAKLAEVAGWIATGPSVVLPGGHANAGADATALAVATLLLNEVAGNVGKTVVFGREARPGRVNGYADVKQLLADAKDGKIGVLILDGVNPVYNLPAADGAAAALDAVETLVQLGVEPDDSTRAKAIFLATTSGLEGWGDAEVFAGVHVLQQPAMNPMKDVRGVGDLVLALGKALVPAAEAAPVAAAPEAADGGAPLTNVLPAPSAMGFAHATWAEYVKARWVKEVLPDGEAGWVAALQRGGHFAPPEKTGAAVTLAALPQAGAAPAAQDKALVIFPGPHLYDGRHANRPWAQELPDPLSTYNWGTWAELNPKTVAALGLGRDDLVSVKTAAGEIECGFFASPGVREDTVAVILGNGHAGMGRYAEGRGANPIALLDSVADPQSGALAYYGARAQVARAGTGSGVYMASGHENPSMSQHGRPIAVLVSAADAAAHLEGKPGSIVAIHHPPFPEQLVEKGLTDMFPEPQHPTYRFAMSIDTNACNGCGACQMACAIENNTPFIGPDQFRRGRTMMWIRMDRFWEGEGEHQDVRHLPSLCQHCAHAPCEGVCPVLATYHNLDGLNAMIYNRCVGTRYCANNCPYTARRFNYHTWQWPESMHLMLNPDVTSREMGVMEKCTFCIQRTRAAKDAWRDMDHAVVPDAALQKLTACAAACPTDAITFGNAKDAEGKVAKDFASPRAYTLLGELNTKPGIRYLARARHDYVAAGGHGGGHGGGESHPAPAGGGHAPENHGGTEQKHGAEGHKEG
ncbi:MAG: molybdopterin dinucleotide binding domain-containing protein [Myxococcota bacterium]